MEINFSRHAERRMRLYKIDERDIRNAIESAIMDKGLIEGKNQTVGYELRKKYHYPLKIVFVVKNDNIMVITAYPLKKERAQ